jgi:hypothetical protein
MTADTTAWESDAAWLMQRIPEATDEQLDAFCYYVTRLVVDMGIELQQARETAYRGQYGTR